MTRRLARRAVPMGALLAILGWTTPTALAAPSAGPPQWAITSVAAPAHFKPGDEGDLYVVTATNVGGAATNGETITIEDSLHGEAEATEVVGEEKPGFGIYGDAFTRNPLICTSPRRGPTGSIRQVGMAMPDIIPQPGGREDCAGGRRAAAGSCG